MHATSCPECAAQIELSADTLIGEIADCEVCGAELEVIAVNPLAVVVAPEIEEDWGE